MTAARRTVEVAREQSPSVTDMTRELDAVARKYGYVIAGDVRIEPIDLTWDAPDAEQWAQYGITGDGRLIRGFW